MLNQQTDLSPDLDWMLQSDQANPDMVLEILVQQYYRPVFQIADAILADGQAARKAVETIFSLAVLEKYRYRGDIRAEVWLYRLALQVAFEQARVRLPSGPGESFTKRAVEASYSGADRLLLPVIGDLQPEERLVLLLREVHGRDIPEISQIMELEASGVFAVLSQARQPVRRALAAQEPEGRSLDTDLSERLAGVWPVDRLDQDEARELIQVIRMRTRQAGSRRRGLAALKETALVALVVVLAFMAFNAANRILPEPEITPTAAQRAVVTQIVLVEITATPQPTRTPQPTEPSQSSYPSRSVFYAARESDTLASIASRLDIHLETLLALNWDLASNQPLDSGELVVVATRPAPSPTTSPTPHVSSGPLHPDASPDEVLERMGESRSLWNTFWADGMIVYHGPPGYTGRPQVRREQVWVSQPYSSLVLSGGLRGEPDQVWFSLDGKVYDLDTNSGNLVLYDFHSMQLPVYSDLEGLIFPGPMALAADNLEVLGSGIVAGRPALEVLWRSESQGSVTGWIDRETGVPLWIIEQAAGGVPVRELRLLDVVFDETFPAWIFDRNRLPVLFAQDYRGLPSAQQSAPAPAPTQAPGHTSLDRPPAPDGFDPSQSRLEFQWSQPEIYNSFEANWGAELRPRVDESLWTVQVEIFSEEYFLGSMEISPWNAVCRRSPDGSRLALVRFDVALNRETDYFHWVSLSEPDNVHSLQEFFLPGGHLAWSPDGRHLALTGCTIDQRCGVYLLDVESEQFRRAISAGDPGHLAWSPDGGFLAAIGHLPTSVKWGVQVVDLTENEVVYAAELDGRTGTLPPDSPTHAWGYDPTGEDYSALEGWLAGCADPQPRLLGGSD